MNIIAHIRACFSIYAGISNNSLAVSTATTVVQQMLSSLEPWVRPPQKTGFFVNGTNQSAYWSEIRYGHFNTYPRTMAEDVLLCVAYY